VCSLAEWERGGRWVAVVHSGNPEGANEVARESIESMTTDQIQVCHVVRGRRFESRGNVVDMGEGYPSLVTPELDLDQLIWTIVDGFPALSLDLDEILDFLEAVGHEIEVDRNGRLEAAVSSLARVNPLSRESLTGYYRGLSALFDRKLMEFEYSEGLGRSNEHWREVNGPSGRTFDVRAMPTRMVHIMAGNAPANASLAIIRTALTKGVGLLKLPSNDPFTAPAMLSVMADLDASHPIVQSLSCAYWRGGDETVESVLYRPQFFDKVVAWGGEGAIRNVLKYLGPGLSLVSFDPKTSISMIGRHVFTPGADLRSIAALGAVDVRYQEGCSTSRFQFVEGDVDSVDLYCELLLEELLESHRRLGGTCRVTPTDIRADVAAMRAMPSLYRVWGSYDGTGLIVRSDEPVDFYPDARTVNVVRLDDVRDAYQYINVATQTIGVYPPELKSEIRNDLASIGGVDRIVNLGGSSLGVTGGFGSPHDGMYPLDRLVRWVYCDA
jgi:hypothetical protein